MIFWPSGVFFLWNSFDLYFGDFGGFELTKDVHKLFTNQKGFTQKNVEEAFETMDSKLKHRYKKIEIRGQRD